MGSRARATWWCWLASELSLFTVWISTLVRGQCRGGCGPVKIEFAENGAHWELIVDWQTTSHANQQQQQQQQAQPESIYHFLQCHSQLLCSGCFSACTGWTVSLFRFRSRTQCAFFLWPQVIIIKKQLPLPLLLLVALAAPQTISCSPLWTDAHWSLVLLVHLVANQVVVRVSAAGPAVKRCPRVLAPVPSLPDSVPGPNVLYSRRQQTDAERERS